MYRQHAHANRRRDTKGENMSERYVLRVELTTRDDVHYESIINVQNLIDYKLRDYFHVDSTEIKQVVSA